MPSWQRVVSAIPDIFGMLSEAVEADAEEFGGQTTGRKVAASDSKRLRQRVRLHLAEIYGAAQADKLTERLLVEAGLKGYKLSIPAAECKWSERDAVLITYGDSILKSGQTPLQTLNGFLTQHVSNTFTGVHILPFFPYSSDDGFSISDYTAVRHDLGGWEDIEEIGQRFKVMSDLVLNHCSSQHQWF